MSLHELAEIGQIAAGAASILVFGSVLLVRKQVKLQADTSETEMVTGMTTLITSVSRVFIEYPTMQKYFHEGAHPTAEDSDRARAIAMTMANVLDHVVGHLHLMDHRTRVAWCTYIGETHLRSPVLQEMLRDHPGWWPGLQTQLAVNTASY
jgi:hypothetical protein